MADVLLPPLSWGRTRFMPHLRGRPLHLPLAGIHCLAATSINQTWLLTCRIMQPVFQLSWIGTQIPCEHWALFVWPDKGGVLGYAVVVPCSVAR